MQKPLTSKQEQIVAKAAAIVNEFYPNDFKATKHFIEAVLFADKGQLELYLEQALGSSFVDLADDILELRDLKR